MSVRTNLDAATAHKVATVLLRTTRKARELLAPGPSSIHADLLRLLQRRFVTKFIPSPFLGICWSAPECLSYQKAPVLLVVQAFSGRKGVVSQDYFHVQ